MSETRNKPLIEIESEQKRLTRHFFEVVSAYVRIRSLSPITAVNPDDEGVPNKQLNASAIEYLVDVEAATKRALNNDTNLLQQWETLAYQEAQVPNATKIASRCGRIYERRKLLPHAYFHRVKSNPPGIPRVPLPAKVAA
jgi:hypothetical protein